MPTTASSAKSNRGFGSQLSIAGTRPQMNNYRMDGISTVDATGGSPGSVLGVSLGVDEIGEFSVLTANYSSEYGRTAGGVVNAITKSGTNAFHGDAYWFLRDEGLDARSFRDKPGNVPPFHRNQFGGSLGGPIQKNKTFFFADFEGFRQSLGTTTTDNVPSADARNGILNFASASQFPAGCLATAVTNQCQLTVDPLVAPFLPLWPVPQTTAPGSNIGLIGV
jgi:hypothetical protein